MRGEGSDRKQAREGKVECRSLRNVRQTKEGISLVAQNKNEGKEVEDQEDRELPGREESSRKGGKGEEGEAGVKETVTEGDERTRMLGLARRCLKVLVERERRGTCGERKGLTTLWIGFKGQKKGGERR